MGFPAPWLIALVLLCFLLAAIPTRRLSQAGIRPGWLGSYLLVLVILGVVAVAARGPGRFLIPLLVVLYVAPLIVAPDTAARWLRRGRRPPKHVGSGPGRDVGSGPGRDVGSGPGRDVGSGPGRDVGSGPGRDVGPDDPPVP